jgi:hypothetical protein
MMTLKRFIVPTKKQQVQGETCYGEIVSVFNQVNPIIPRIWFRQSSFTINLHTQPCGGFHNELFRAGILVVGDVFDDEGHRFFKSAQSDEIGFVIHHSLSGRHLCDICGHPVRQGIGVLGMGGNDVVAEELEAFMDKLRCPEIVAEMDHVHRVKTDFHPRVTNLLDEPEVRPGVIHGSHVYRLDAKRDFHAGRIFQNLFDRGN